jgi:2-keto-4-pentenoate hydratase/2-oxohepta-3-ene-1,7-dioic acid hydratase in catechol pathway
VKLATVISGDAYRLHIVTDDGLVDLDGAAAALGEELARGISDVGALMRRGEMTLEAVQHVCNRLDEVDVAVVSRESVALGPPVVAPSKILCVGLNYVLHAEEGKSVVPPEPLLFAKLPSALVGDGMPVHYHPTTSELDYEGELAVIMGRRASRVAERDALDCVGAFTIFNDISARDRQASEPQWIRGKSLDTFAPVGPYAVTTEEIGDVDSLRIQTRVNGELRQDAVCSDMINSVPQLIAFITEAITLEPGDIIATGTPHGVGLGFDPPRYLRPGDVIEVTIAEIGTLRSPIVERPDSSVLKAATMVSSRQA